MAAPLERRGLSLVRDGCWAVGRNDMDRMEMGGCRRRDTRRKGLPITLEKILNLGHILLVPVFGPGEVPSPFRRTPDFQAVIHPHEENFLIFIYRDELTKAAGDEYAAGLIDVRGTRLRHHMVHEQTALILIQGSSGPLQYLFPFLG